MTFGSTLEGGSGAASGFAYGVFNLGGGVTCGATAMFQIYKSCLRAAVCFYPKVMSGIVGVGLRRAWVRSSSTCVAAYFDEIPGNVRVAWEKIRSVGDSLFSRLGDVGC